MKEAKIENRFCSFEMPTPFKSNFDQNLVTELEQVLNSIYFAASSKSY